MKTSPSFGRMSAETNPHSPRTRMNGDESRSEAAQMAATAVVDRVPPAVSHASGLETSPTGRAPVAVASAVGPPALADHPTGHDLGRGRLAGGEVRDRTRLLRDDAPGSPTSRQDGAGLPQGAGPRALAPLEGAGCGGPRSDPAPLRRAV